MQSNSLFCEIQLSLHEIPNSIMISLFHLCEIISGRPKIQGIFYLQNQYWQTINSKNFLFAKSDYLETYYFCEIISGRPKIQGIFYLQNQYWQTINSQNFLYAKSDYLETYYFAKSIVVDHKFKEFSISEIKSIYGVPNLILMISQNSKSKIPST